MYSDTVISVISSWVFGCWCPCLLLIGEASGWAPDCGQLREMHGLASLPKAHSWIHKASFYLRGHCGFDQNILNMIWFINSTIVVHRDQGLKYNVTPGDEVEDMFALLSEVKRQIPSISAVSSGAIASDYQRLRVESVCSRLGLISLAYLWKQDQTLLLEEMVPWKFQFL